MQEKKVKKIADMNVDPSKAVGNGNVASSSNNVSPKPYLANGGSISVVIILEALSNFIVSQIMSPTYKSNCATLFRPS